ncbi:MAG TPA: type III-A CRISPR-associated RAMP protein Csm3 [Bacteroidetes bacterium]|nr:type III-A CRISPR-associated RAMP protein Csm3 [Candidatus Limimorpha avicola]
MKKLVKKIKMNSTIELLTGLHIGGNSDNVEIGGIDNPVIKIATKDNQPYIPGSSLKGKMRCLLEQIAGATEVGNDTAVNKLFGFSQNNQPSKLIVRDAMLTETSINMLENCDNLDMPYTEGKWENVIDRVKGTASNPRQTERIPAGVSFEVEFIINIWDDDDEKEFLELLKKGINALENDYLGGNGSRGYGQIKFDNIEYHEASEETKWKMEKKLTI